MFYYDLCTLSFGQVGLVWIFKEKMPSLIRVVLPDHVTTTTRLIEGSFPDVQPGIHERLDEISRQLINYDQGKEWTCPSNMFSYQSRSKFYENVWEKIRLIPRGYVSTYGRVAKAVMLPQGARSIGMAMANNPLPLIIPCHRVIKSNGRLGGFTGSNTSLKKYLLEREGVVFDNQGRVMPGLIIWS